MTLAANLAALARRVVGLSANNLVALDANGKLPAVDGSLLKGIQAVGLKNARLITASGSVAPSAGGTAWLAFGVGGGGGSGYSGAGGPTSGAGGGGGFISFSSVNTAASYSVAIGSGGVGGNFINGTPGAYGGSTTLTIGGTTFTADGGGPSTYNTINGSVREVGGGGNGGNGLVNAAGQAGSTAAYGGSSSYWQPGSGGAGAFGFGYGMGARGAQGGNAHGNSGAAGCLLILEF